MPAFVSADEATARAGAIHNTALDAVQSAMGALADVKFTSTPVDKDGNPIADTRIEDEMEEAHRRRVLAGTARSSLDLVAQHAEAPTPPLVVTLQAELDGLGIRLGNMRAQYMLDERALMAQIEQVATRLAMAKEMSK